MYISILDHSTKVIGYESILVSFVVVLSVREDKMWEAYLSRLFIVVQAVYSRRAMVENKIQAAISRAKAEEHSAGHPSLCYLWLALQFWEELQVNSLGNSELNPSVRAMEDMLAIERGPGVAETDSDG